MTPKRVTPPALRIVELTAARPAYPGGAAELRGVAAELPSGAGTATRRRSGIAATGVARRSPSSTSIDVWVRGGHSRATGARHKGYVREEAVQKAEKMAKEAAA